MKKQFLLLAGSLLILSFQLSAQEYTAASYWNMEHDPVYTNLLSRQARGDTLSLEEQRFFTEYKTKLNDYFEKLSDNEKSIYYKIRAQSAGKPGEMYMVTPRQETDIYSGERSKFTQYLIANGIFGALYGGATAVVLGVEDEGVATGITLLSAGASVLVPLLTIKDKYVPYNSLSLSIHGKAIGALQGVALGALIAGDNIDDGKFLLALSAASSITLGRIGYSLGKTQPWSEGRVALYSYYGFLMPLEGLALNAAFQLEDPRIYGLTSLLFGAGGYFLADGIANRNDFTRGDITATITLASLNGLLGFSIFGDITAESDDYSAGTILIPAIGALGGTLAGHLWLKDAKLTIQQGRNIGLATAGGSLIGLGLIALVTPETAAPYYVSGYITGMTTYAIMVGMYKKKNNIPLLGKELKSGWNLNIMPQNIFMNKKISSYAFANPGKRIDFLPAFSATLKF